MHLAVNPEEVTNLAEVQIQEKTRNKAYTPEREYQRSETFWRYFNIMGCIIFISSAFLKWHISKVLQAFHKATFIT